MHRPFHAFRAACLAFLLLAPAPALAVPPAPASPTPRDRALASPVPVWQRAGLLVEQGGRALYVFEDDAPGRSRCDARCMALWPPHYAAPGAKPHGPFTIARSHDGRPMWAWQGRPLYRWVSDRRRGAAGGDGVADAWFLVRVPPELASAVVPYFPMPMPRTPRPAAPSRPSVPETDR
jgi:predicted lipoprotein with Yx(FWY)xxD motif